jgi:cyclopropane fatty-acyl-phospholipid synthase-like methyltransferase
MNEETRQIDLAQMSHGYDRIMFDPELPRYLEHGDYFNYGYWEEDTKSQKMASENLLEHLLAFLPEKKGLILDVACGKGATTRYLAKYFSPENITGINISEEQLKAARASAPGSSFLLMKAEELMFDSASFDAVICVEAAFHFNTRKKFLREAHRVLKSGGCLMLTDILMTRAAERQRKFRLEENFVNGPLQYAEILKECGFNTVEVEDATIFSWEGHFWNVVNSLLAKFLSGEIDLVRLKDKLERTYRVVPDIVYYILATARKP